ncbi:hypothetical protein DFH08DRAFT_893706 [Mycena albidolilacea]|uniref:Uncharacterized protein n=1 Tax=Mycena albidolilacea TaxID=1033008 RepID=A0AAD6ZC09_9AGAR|nr:hypothetical protein DFH08DRAFT_893706 [Mycena albidolilacea]
MNKAVDAQKMHGLSTGSSDCLDGVDGHRAGRDRGGTHTSRSPLMSLNSTQAQRLPTSEFARMKTQPREDGIRDSRQGQKSARLEISGPFRLGHGRMPTKWLHELDLRIIRVDPPKKHANDSGLFLQRLPRVLKSVSSLPSNAHQRGQQSIVCSKQSVSTSLHVHETSTNHEARAWPPPPPRTPYHAAFRQHILGLSFQSHRPNAPTL